MPDVSGALVAGRAAAESRMTSRATIRRKTGGATTNGDGFEVPEWSSALTNLPLRLAGADRGGSGTRTVRIGDSEVQTAVRVAHFPASTSGLRDGDLVEVTSGENAGAVLRIVEASFQDQATALRVPVVEVTRPEEWS